MPKIKVRINKENCISCGSCFAAHPDLFELDTDGKANVTAPYREIEITDPALIAQARSAHDLCPNMAIEIEELPE